MHLVVVAKLFLHFKLVRQMNFQKTVSLVRLIVFVCPFSMLSAVYAQIYEQPKLLKFEKFVQREKENSLIVEKFYPIGWSRNGRFAYLVEPADEACGCYFAKVVLQDLRSGKKLWSYSYVGKEGRKESIETFWKANKRIFSQKLKKYGIIAKREFVLSEGNVNWKSDVLTVRLKVVEDPASVDDFNKVNSIVLELESKLKGRKVIYKEYFGPKDYSGILGAEVVGYLKSPLEPRVAFILVKTRRGYEGPPHITINEVVGASLVYGFGK